MAAMEFIAGRFADEPIKQLTEQLTDIVKKSTLCRASAEQLADHFSQLLPIFCEIKYSGVVLPQHRQCQIDCVWKLIREGIDLSEKVLGSSRWNVYRNLQLARKMEKLEKKVSSFIKGPMQAHILADVHHLRFDTAERFDHLEKSARRIEKCVSDGNIGVGVGVGVGVGTGTSFWLDEEKRKLEGFGGKVELDTGMALDLGVKKVKEMLMGRDDAEVVGVCGIGGIGKTTLALQICNDHQVINHFGNRILFLTVSQSPDVEALKVRIWAFLTGTQVVGTDASVPQWNLQFDWKIQNRKLVILDDVWCLSVLQQLVFRAPGCKTLVNSRTKFQTVFNLIYEVNLLKEDEALALFCLSAFGQKTVPFSADQRLVRQIVKECKGLPLALKVVGASLRNKPQMFWDSAKNRLSRGEPISEAHQINLIEPMMTSITYLSEEVRECFLDLASFPEDKRIPLDVIINMWVEIHDIDEKDAYAILVELSDRNLVTLVKDSRDGDMYSSYYEIYVTQHDVLRDLALHLSNQGSILKRRRLLMPRREEKLPREWERNSDKPFDAQIVSLHTGKMKETDWTEMLFPMAEVLILNFSSSDYFLPSFIANMPRLRALVVINHSTSHATLHNLCVFTCMPNLRSLWLQSVCVPDLTTCAISLEKLEKISLILCKINRPYTDPSTVDLPPIFPHLKEITIDHCINLTQLCKSICWLSSLKTLSITNCHSLLELPADIGMLDSLEILRLSACPKLKSLPPGISQLIWLKYLDISQCINLASLPDGMGRMMSLEKIDMRECSNIKALPKSLASLGSLSQVVCDEEISWMWNEVEMTLSKLNIQIVEECFSLDWLTE